ncbi:hypothetical protein V1478_018630 [Vespula squamosa]|uniref:Uncharacterized protein n=1 Tax=Vespula squamosa TaxID=30214 RepID=A0ABD1ZTA4_VESSQ
MANIPPIVALSRILLLTKTKLNIFIVNSNLNNLKQSYNICSDNNVLHICKKIYDKDFNSKKTYSQIVLLSTNDKFDNGSYHIVCTKVKEIEVFHKIVHNF